MLKKQICNVIMSEIFMKKFTIFLSIIIIIVCIVYALFLNYKSDYNMSKKENYEFEKYLNEEIYGTDVTTLINRAVDSNEKNKVAKNNKGIYLNNDTNSINIELKMIDSDDKYAMEKIYNGGIQNFINYYGEVKFKCIKKEYHKSTNKIKYILFEQTSE